MVQFGHQLAAQRVPGWEKYYIGYKELKKKIKEFRLRRATITEDEMGELIREFAELLDYQVEKVVLFYIQEQGQLAQNLIDLQRKKESSFQANDMAQVATLMDLYRQVGYELLRLLQFVELNLTGLRKILKKFEKNLGVRVMEQYVSSRGQGPYSQLQQLFRTAGVGALVGAITRNLEELRTQQLMPHRTTSFALYRRATLEPPTDDEPVLREIQEARTKLEKVWHYQRFTAAGLLIDLETPMVRRDMELTPEEEAEQFHYPSLWVNLACTFFYMVNYYIIVPTSDDYAILLNMPPSVAGIMIGAMPITALVSTFVYSAWSNRSYREPLIVSTLILILGNVLYALALVFDSVWLVLIGRACNGLGGARAINRRYIADWVPVKQRTQASAAFVSASALGMAAGPAMAGLMTSLDIHVPFLPGRPIVVNDVTAPGWIMTIWWLLFLVGVMVFFKEPWPAITPSPSSANLGGAKRPLLLPDAPEVESGAPPAPDGSEISSEDMEGPAKSLAEVWKEMNTPVLITLLVYFMLKFATEVLISESSIVTKLYFKWTPRSVGVFLSILGLTVLPCNYLIGSFIGNVYEDRLVIVWTEMITVVGVVLNLSFAPFIAYSLPQYAIGAILIFVGTCALEGVNMALLSKTMSPRLAKGTYNCGLLSTEAGTLARAVADVMITVVGGFGQMYLLNFTMLPVLLVAGGSTLVTLAKYRSLKTAL